MHGKGEFEWPDGRKYIGGYVADKKHGYGEFFWPDGRIYEGNWKNGIQHGRGVYTSRNGFKREGEWKNGKKYKWLGNPNSNFSVQTSNIAMTID